ncbi:VWA domain-containing protein [Meiothermus sp. QL-1]|uniref:vWA domain-containing protein n=1 Tax=Meiothermus sp. QL-1 TaxID=2058095 RepID=UPI000E0A75E0|nr:VWA domain-containing protein [Meiothermus sp. QL-1]RDI94779.1 VWA domain-containing protein [Meiothermus sp. QL-1]
MQLAFALPWALVLIPPALGLIWWWYRRRRPPERRVAGLWLWQRALRKGRARRRLDLRLLLLLLAALLGFLALSGPSLSLERPGPLIVVLDTAASMAATDLPPSRFQRALELARAHLQKAPQAVLVLPGDPPQVFGPAPGSSLVPALEQAAPRAQSTDLAQALAQGQARLPQAPSLVISDKPPPPGSDGYLNVAGNGPNVGISAIGPGFVAVANAGPGLWRGEVWVNGRRYPLEVPARGFASLEVPQATLEARLLLQDSLGLDDEARFTRRAVRVEVSGEAPALERVLRLLGTARGSPGEMVFELGTPRREPSRFTVFFAREASGQATVFDVERTLPYLRGVELVGYSLRIPPAPQAPGWRPLAQSETGQALAWYHPNGLYLPPVESLQDLPAFPVLLYNLVAPRGEQRSGLLRAEETLLPRPIPSQPLPPGLTLSLGPPLALLAALVLGLELLLFQRPRRAAGLELGT